MELTSADLGAVRLAESPFPFFEIANLAKTVRLARQRPAWLNGPHGRVSPAAWAMVSTLCGLGCSPGFVTPAVSDVDEAIEVVMATTRALIGGDFEYSARMGYPVPEWASELAGAGRRATRLRYALGAALRQVQDAAGAPVLRRLQPYASAHRVRLAATMAEAGAAATLNALHPKIRFRPPILEIDLVSGVQVRIESAGAGVLLVPTAYPGPFILTDTTGAVPFIVGYPVSMPPATRASLVDGDADTTTVQALQRLLGGTRAAVLVSVAHEPEMSTRELARCLGISAASASEHATVLRGAGLINTDRHGGAVAHVLTALGRELLDGHRPALRGPTSGAGDPTRPSRAPG